MRVARGTFYAHNIQTRRTILVIKYEIIALNHFLSDVWYMLEDGVFSKEMKRHIFYRSGKQKFDDIMSNLTPIKLY